MSENSQTLSGYNSTTDGFLIVGSFNEFGMAQGTIDPKFGKINEIRLHVHTNSKQFIILSEVSEIKKKKINDINYQSKSFSL